MRVEIRNNNTLQVFTLGITTNKKIAVKGEKIVQTYIYSKFQYVYVQKCLNNNESVNFNEFFKLADTNCLDCPFSMLSEDKRKCYTHKYMQFSGFISSIKSIVRKYGDFNNIPELSFDLFAELVIMANNRYVRFGTYGEPVLHNFDLVSNMVSASKSYTSYTHQWRKPQYNDFNRFFMASVHNEATTLQAEKLGFRSFVIIDKNTEKNNVFVSCPASKEMNFKSNCSKCALCSGIDGKGKKSVAINIH